MLNKSTKKTLMPIEVDCRNVCAHVILKDTVEADVVQLCVFV